MSRILAANQLEREVRLLQYNDEIVLYAGIKRKAIRRDGDLKEVVQMLSEIERETQEKYEEREDK